jgi:glutamate dehydrogenase (NAD(P)+)
MGSHEANQIYFNRAADQLDLSASMRALLLTAKREVQVQIPVELDSGDLATFIGYRVQHNDARGPLKGGLRSHPQVDLDEVRSLAALMTWKTAVATAARRGASRSIPRSYRPANWSGSPVASSTPSTISSAPMSTSRRPTWARRPT